MRRRRSRHGLRRRDIPHVDGHADGGEAVGLHCVGGFGGGALVDVGQYHGGAGFAERTPVGQADATGTTGDHGDLPAQVEELRDVHRAVLSAALTAAGSSSNIAAASDSVKCFSFGEGEIMGAATAAQRDVWTRDGLSSRERRLVAIACVGFRAPGADHRAGARRARERRVHHRRDARGGVALRGVLRLAQGVEPRDVRTPDVGAVQEERGEDSSPLPRRPSDVTELGSDDWEARIARGEEEFRVVNLVPAPGRDSPYQHAGILNFVFGHVWQRPGLGRRDRRFLTVACVGVDEAPLPILSHVGSALGSGDVSKSEMAELILTFRGIQ